MDDIAEVPFDGKSLLVLTSDEPNMNLAADLHARTGMLVVVVPTGTTLASIDDEQLAAIGLVRITDGLRTVVESSDREFLWTDHHRADHECSMFDEESAAVRRVLGQ